MQTWEWVAARFPFSRVVALQEGLGHEPHEKDWMLAEPSNDNTHGRCCHHGDSELIMGWV